MGGGRGEDVDLLEVEEDKERFRESGTQRPAGEGEEGERRRRIGEG